jgi:hypothetical protein
MTDTWRFSIGRLLVITAAVGIAIAGWAKAHHVKKERDRLESLIDPRKLWPPNVAQLRHLPITVTLSDDGGMRVSDSWFATVNSAGAGLLEIRDLDSPERADFTVSESQFTQLREAMIAEHFFALPDEVGDAVPDAPTETITVVLGQYSKTVRIQYLGNLANVPPHISSRQPQLEAARTLRVWLLARAWVNHPRASDSSQYARRALAWLDPSSATTVPPTPKSDGSTND